MIMATAILHRMEGVMHCPICNARMEEEFGCINDTDNDEIYDVMMGYTCKCGFKMDTNGEEVE